jgi:hypothetical protein
MPGIKVDGNVYTLSQSWINTFMNCPEQARLEMRGELPRKESDATAIGTAMHTAIETVLEGNDINDGWQAGADALSDLVNLDEFQYVQIKTEETLFNTYGRVFHTWANEIYPQLPQTRFVEHPFDVVLCETPTATIRLAGSIDFVDEFGEIWDWKTANRPYDQWQVDRYKIQPTAYGYGLLMSTDMELDENITFNYAVMMKSKQDCSVYTTTRNSGHYIWLQEQCKAIIAMIEADLPTWPLNDQHALCSPTWCTAWETCKGSFIDNP